jgi:hypothetical protein
MEGRFEEAREVTRQMLTRSPAAVGLQVQLNALDALLGRSGPAILNLRKLAEREPSANMALASAEATAGHRTEALRLMKPIEQKYNDGDVPAFQFALFYSLLDDLPVTVKWLERSVDAHEGGAMRIRVHPYLAKWQDAPALHALKKRVNLDD